MAAFASTFDLADMWRPLTPAEDVTATALLDRVSSLIRTRLPGIDARMVADPNLTELVRGVALDAVLRVLRNPDGLVQESVGGYSYSRASGSNAGALYVSDAEWALLLPTAGSWSGAFTIRPGRVR